MDDRITVDAYTLGAVVFCVFFLGTFVGWLIS